MSTDTRSPSSLNPSDKASSTELGEILPVQHDPSKSRYYIETQWGSIIGLSDEEAKLVKDMRSTDFGSASGPEVEAHSQIESKSEDDGDSSIQNIILPVSQFIHSGENTLSMSDQQHRRPSFVARTDCPSKMQQRRAQQMINTQRIKNRKIHTTRSRTQVEKDSLGSGSDDPTLVIQSDHDVNTTILSSVTSSDSGKNYKIGNREMKALLKS
ncbi:hypothetical protein L486_06159 [Kwoniella mangroviensis CBS 10435]|uniref:Uncharacterized protein n=1 Tax=Kwoniella mangroviensis CBS 10435 TaxID=1331196 RepID=A0A1B9IKM4_9TREE|nr:hypothetical protein L486_06159 [Kwoniella mangroviensis CBS 10435]